MSRSGFRLNCRWIFLTYPRAEDGEQRLERGTIYEFLEADGCCCWAIAKELHEDGAVHYHALVHYPNKRNIKRANYFDLLGHHPNVQAARDPRSVFTYIGKDGDCETSSGFDDCIKLGSNKKVQYIELAEAGDVGGALADFKQRHPRDYVLSYDRVRANLRRISGGRTEDPRFSIDDFKQSALDTVAGWRPEEKSLVLSGGSGTGKTEFARALAGGEQLWVTHIDTLRDLAEQPVIIFDDMCFEHYPRESFIHLIDPAFERQIHCRYATATIPAGVARIFTTNKTRSGFYPKGCEEDEAINRRIKWVNVIGKMF